MSIRYFDIKQDEQVGYIAYVVDQLLEIEYSDDDSAWCVMINDRVAAKSENYNRVKNYLDYIRIYPHDNI